MSGSNFSDHGDQNLLNWLPANLQTLNCTSGSITSIDYLPAKLQMLECCRKFPPYNNSKKKHKCWIHNQINKPGKFDDIILYPRYCEDDELEYLRDMNLVMLCVLNDINYMLGVDVRIACNCYQQYFGYLALKELQKKLYSYDWYLPDDIIKNILRFID